MNGFEDKQAAGSIDPFNWTLGQRQNDTTEHSPKTAGVNWLRYNFT